MDRSILEGDPHSVLEGMLRGTIPVLATTSSTAEFSGEVPFAACNNPSL